MAKESLELQIFQKLDELDTFTLSKILVSTVAILARRWDVTPQKVMEDMIESAPSKERWEDLSRKIGSFENRGPMH